MTWSDGKVYDGEWLDGKQHGEGQYTFLGKDNKLVTKKGKWENGARIEWIKN